MAVVCLSLSCPVSTLNREWKAVAIWKLTEAHDIGDSWPHLEVQRSKFMVIMSSEDELQTWFRDDMWWPTSPTCMVTSKVKGQGNKVMSSVWCTLAHNLTTKSRRNTKIGRKVVHAMADNPHQFQGQKVKVTRPLNTMIGNQPYLQNRKTCELQTWYTDGAQRPVLTCAVTSKLKAVRLFKTPFAGGGGILWRPHYRPHSLFISSWNCIRSSAVNRGRKVKEKEINVYYTPTVT